MIDDVGGNIDLASLARLWGHGQSRGPPVRRDWGSAYGTWLITGRRLGKLCRDASSPIRGWSAERRTMAA